MTGFIRTLIAKPWASMMALLVAAAAVIAFVSPTLAPDVGPVGAAIGLVTATVVGIRACGSLDENERLGWTVIVGAFAIASIGLVVVGIATVAGMDIPAIGPFDLFFLGAYLMFFAGALLLPAAARMGSDRLRMIVDGAVGTIAVGSLAWLWLIEEIVADLQDAPVWQHILGVAYPMFGVAGVIMVMALFLRRRHEATDRRLILLGLGLITQAAADLSFVSSAGGDFAEATPQFWLFCTAVLFYLLLTIVLDNRPDIVQTADREPQTWPLLAPYTVAVVLLATLVWSVFNGADNHAVRILVVASAAVGVLMAVRQVAAIRDLSALVEVERRSLIASVSHELRTPLTAMVGFLQVLQDPDSDLEAGEASEFLDLVEQQSRYLARIVGDLTMLARVGEEDLRLEFGVVRLRTVIDRVLDSIDHDLGGFEITCPDDIWLEVDPERLQQILVNYITNALRYGGDRRHIVGAVEGRTVRVEVHDSGSGVPIRHQYTMWQRFNRGAHHLNAAVPGSGIGLAIVKVIASAHDAVAGYRRSERLGGACFYVEFPERLIPNPERPANVAHTLDTVRSTETARLG